MKLPFWLCQLMIDAFWILDGFCGDGLLNAGCGQAGTVETDEGDRGGWEMEVDGGSRLMEDRGKDEGGRWEMAEDRRPRKVEVEVEVGGKSSA